MKFILTDTSWILDDLDPIEWTFLDRIPEMAAGEDLPHEQRRRILPDPIDVPAGQRENYEEFLKDWNEYVRPDLNASFGAARDQVSRDLAMAAVKADPSDDPDELDFDHDSEPIPMRVEVARTASDAWYSALNQARLLMNEAHDLAESTERFRWPSEDDDQPFDGARMLLLAQYEFYTAMQSILIEVMTLNDAPEEF
ncbi:MAG: hypothetical protein KDN20_07120 [Verrucomicrobiae bacterium]|nr:hypothetical protein [Verrucomicrobiae bacterium]